MLFYEIFPETYYQLHAFTGFDGRTIMPILKQDLVKNAKLSITITFYVKKRHVVLL